MSTRADLRCALTGERIILAPGVWDGMSALLAQEAGLTACCVSGSAIANMRFGRPDIGLVSMSVRTRPNRSAIGPQTSDNPQPIKNNAKSKPP